MAVYATPYYAFSPEEHYPDAETTHMMEHDHAFVRQADVRHHSELMHDYEPHYSHDEVLGVRRALDHDEPMREHLD